MSTKEGGSIKSSTEPLIEEHDTNLNSSFCKYDKKRESSLVREVLEVKHGPDEIFNLSDDGEINEGTNSPSIKNIPIQNLEKQKTMNDNEILVDDIIINHYGSFDSVHETKTEEVIYDFETHKRGGQSDKACQTNIDLKDVDSIDILDEIQDDDSIDMDVLNLIDEFPKQRKAKDKNFEPCAFHLFLLNMLLTFATRMDQFYHFCRMIIKILVKFGKSLLKLGLSVILPCVDIGFDIRFTVKCFRDEDWKYGYVSDGVIFVYIKICEISGEAMFQLHLQLYVLLSDGFGDNDSDTDKILRICSIGTSFLSLMYGMANYNLYQLYQKEIELSKVFKFLLANLICQTVNMLLPLSNVCLFSIAILERKARTFNSTEEIELFENISATYSNNHTRENIKFNQKEVITLSFWYIIGNLFVATYAIYIYALIEFNNKERKLDFDLNNIVNPMNIAYQENIKSLNKLRKVFIRAQCVYSCMLMTFSGVSVIYVIMQKLKECNGSYKLCKVLEDKMFRFGIFQCRCFIIGLVGLVLSIVETIANICSLECYKNLIKSLYVIGDELQWDETESNNNDEHEATNDEVNNDEDNNALIQTLSTEVTNENVEDVEMQPLTSIGDTENIPTRVEVEVEDIQVKKTTVEINSAVTDNQE